MVLNPNKNLKLYYSIKEVAQRCKGMHPALLANGVSAPQSQDKRTEREAVHRQGHRADKTDLQSGEGAGIQDRRSPEDDKPEPQWSGQECRRTRHAHICARPADGNKETDRRTCVTRGVMSDTP